MQKITKAVYLENFGKTHHRNKEICLLFDIYDLLAKYGAPESSRLRFVDQMEGFLEKDCNCEWRFQGDFGYGGKFKWSDDDWRVDYYREDETPEREMKLIKLNQELKLLCDNYFTGTYGFGVCEGLLEDG